MSAAICLRLLPVLLVLGLLPAAAGAAARPPSHAQLRAVAGKLIPAGSVLTEVSAPAELAQGTRRLVVEFRPEDRGGASAISRATYDPANPLPLHGLVIRATRNGSVLTYDLTAVSESQPRFYIRGQKAGGQQVYLQMVSLDLQRQLGADDPELEAWLTQLQFSAAYRVPGGATAQAAGMSSKPYARLIEGFVVLYRRFKYCSMMFSGVPRLPISRIPGNDRCKIWLEHGVAGWVRVNLTGTSGRLIAQRLSECSAPMLRRDWQRITGYRIPAIVVRTWVVVRLCA